MESGNGNGNGAGVRHASLIRGVNERIREVSGRVESFEVLCECGRPECDLTVEVTAARWAEISREGHVFLVAPAHEAAGNDPERVPALPH